MSIPRRLGRIARGLVSNLQEDERFRETLRPVRERGEALRGAFEAAMRGASEEWRAAEEDTQVMERADEDDTEILRRPGPLSENYLDSGENRDR